MPLILNINGNFLKVFIVKLPIVPPVALIIPLIVANLIIGFVFSGIDNLAHIGGLIGGVVTFIAIFFIVS